MSGRIQRHDVKTAAELAALGAPKSSLINDSQIYLSAMDGKNLTLAEAISLGVLGAHAPLYLRAAETPDATVEIVASRNKLPDGTTEVNGTATPWVPDFVLSTLNFQTGASSGGTISATFPSTTAGLFRRAVFSLQADNTLKVTFSTAVATLGAMENPGQWFEPGAHHVGWIDLESTGGTGFKTAGSASAIIENEVGGESRIFNLVRGGGSGYAPAITIEPTSMTRWLTGMTTLQAVLNYLDANTLLAGTGTPADGRVVVINGTTNKNLRITSMTVDTNGNVTIPGNLTVQGTTFSTETETVRITDNLLRVNNGEVGAGVTARSAGMIVDRGTLNPYAFLFSEPDDAFRIGEQVWEEGQSQGGGATTLILAATVDHVDPEYFNGKYVRIRAGFGAGQVRQVAASGSNWNNTTKTLTVSSAWSSYPQSSSEYEILITDSTQAVATRENTPTSNAVAFWNASANRFDTHAGLVYISATGQLWFRAFGGTGAVTVPTGTNSERPGTPVTGDFRYNSDLSSFEGWDGTAWGSLGGGGTVTRVTQTTHGFSVGQSVYVAASAMALSKADAIATAEVAGSVSRVLDANTFEYTTCGMIKSIPTALFDATPVQGDVVFLSVTTAGNFQTTDPNEGGTVGHISKPLGQVTRVGGGTVDVLFNNGFRANVVGSVNVWSVPVALANGGTTNVQSLAGYQSVRVRAVVTIDAAQDLRSTFELSITKKADNSDYLLVVVGDDGEKQTSGDSIVTWSITSAGLLQCTLPSYASFTSANVVFTLGDTPSLGVSFPLSFSGKQMQDEKTVQVYTASGAIASGASATQHVFNSASPLSMTMGSAVGISGARIPLKNIGAGTVTVDFFGTETCEGNLTISLLQWESVVLMAYNGGWIVVG